MSDILRHLCQMACQTKQGGLPTINHPQEDLGFALELLSMSIPSRSTEVFQLNRSW